MKMNISALALCLSAGMVGTAFAQCPGAPTVIEDLGTLTPGAVVTRTPALAANGVAWYKFTLPASARYQDLTFLDINTVGSVVTDTEVGLYNCAGNFLGGSDDEGPSSLSALSFGHGEGTWPGGATLSTNTVNNGRNMDLPAGDYYVAVGGFNITYNATAFGAVGTSGPAGTYAVNIKYGSATVAAAPANLVDLGTIAPGGAIHRVGVESFTATNKVQWYKVIVPEGNAATGTYFDADTEGSVLTATNATCLALYTAAGALSSNIITAPANTGTGVLSVDTTDGSGSLSQLTYGLTSPVRPAVGTGLTYNGRDGGLRPGTYYIGVSNPGTAPILSSSTTSNTTGINLGMTSTSTNTGTIGLHLVSGASSTNPSGVGGASPATANNCGSATSRLTVTVTPGAFPTSTAHTVTVDLSSIGGSSTQAFFDNATNGDVTANDNVFSYLVTVPAATATGAKTFPYTIQETAPNARTGTGNITGLTVTVCPPANDTCAGAIAVGVGTTACTNVGALLDGPQSTCRTASGPDVFYTFTPTQTGTYAIDTCQSATPNFYDSVLTVLSGTCGSFTELACSDDFGGTCGTSGFASKVSLPLTAGVTYYIRVASYSTTTTLGTFILNIDQPIIPLGVAGNAASGQEMSTVLLTATVTPGTIPNSTGTTVTGDLSTIGGSATQAFYDDNTNGDAVAGDNIFSYSYTLPVSVVTGAYSLPLSAADLETRTATGTLALTVSNGPSGACCTSGTCSLTRQTLCVGGSGTWQGNGTTCGGPNMTITTSANTFEDISATGTVLATISNADDGTESVTLPFTFTHLGNPYTSVNVSSNGNLQFGASNSTEYANVAIPNTAAPNDMLAPAWDDFDLDEAGGGQGTVYYLDDSANGRVIFSWQGCSQFLASPVDSNNFQVILYSSGNAEFRYGAMNNINNPTVSGDTVTIGFENVDGTFGGSVNPATAVGAGNTALLLTAVTDPNPCGPVCDSIDFNNDGLFPDTTDIDDFLSVFSGGPCTNDPLCGDIDFNNDGLFPDTTDIDSLLSVFSGGPCF